VDEIDHLLNRKQDVIYNLFDWPGRRHARLVVLGIANTMDLPERLIPRVHSRLALKRLTFQAYTRTQLQTIISARLEGLNVFNSDAVELCSRKVASMTGDVRKALQICRRAAELCQEDLRVEAARIAAGGGSTDEEGMERKKVSTIVMMTHITRAVDDLFDSNFVEAVRSLGAHQKVLLASLMLETKKRNADEVDMETVLERHERIARNRGLYRLPATAELRSMCTGLAQSCFIRIEESRTTRSKVLTFEMHPEDIHYALRNDELWGQLPH